MVKLVLWAEGKRAPSGIRKLLTALSERLQLGNAVDWTKDMSVKKMLKGLEQERRELLGDEDESVEREALPLGVVKKFYLEKPENMRMIVWVCNRVLILMGFATMRRPGEWEQVKRKHVRFEQQTGYVYMIRLKKTKTLKKGRTIVVDPTGGLFCPVTALKIYMERLPGNDDDALFPDMGKGSINMKKGITPDAVSKVVTLAAAFAGVDGRFTGHSLRIGGATAALQGGATVEQIRAVGDWSSDAVWLYLWGVGAAAAGVRKAMGL